jgi:hypothetical protein
MTMVMRTRECVERTRAGVERRCIRCLGNP